MRNLIAAIGLMVVCLVAASSSAADDKEDKQSLDRLKKELAEIEPIFEKEDWAVARKKLIAELRKDLDKAERMELYRLNARALPEGNPQKKKEFHGYEILAEVTVSSGNQRKGAAAFLGSKLHWSEFRKAACFNPRHGMKLVSGKRTLEFLICFECWQVDVYEGGKGLGRLAVDFTEGKNPLDQSLQELTEKKQGRK